MRDPSETGRGEPVVREWSGGEEPTAAVVTAVARQRGVAPDALAPLSAAVDPDAVRALFDGDGDPTVQFDYEGCVVTVDARTVAVAPLRRRVD